MKNTIVQKKCYFEQGKSLIKKTLYIKKTKGHLRFKQLLTIVTIKTTFEVIKAFKINAKNYMQKRKEKKRKQLPFNIERFEVLYY